MQGPEIVIRRRCRHSQLHAHSGVALNAEETSTRSYFCTEGDQVILAEGELRARLFAELAEHDPRLTIEQATAQADKLVDQLYGLLREGSLTWR